MTRSAQNPNYRMAHKASITDDGLKVVWFGLIEIQYVMSTESAAQRIHKQAAVLFPGDSEARVEFERLVNKEE